MWLIMKITLPLCLSYSLNLNVITVTGISWQVEDLIFISSFLTLLEPQQLALLDAIFSVSSHSLALLQKVNCNNWSGIMELLIAEMAGFYRKRRQIQRFRKTCSLSTHTLLSLILTLPFLPFIPLISFYSAFLKACCGSFKAFGLQSEEKAVESYGIDRTQQMAVCSPLFSSVR